MSDINQVGRSAEAVTKKDLQRLKVLALQCLASLFESAPYSAQFQKTLKAICLGQGAAKHCVDGTNGVKDFDLWCFFEPVSGAKFPPRWRGIMDFGTSNHGTWPGDKGVYQGRRVDIMGRDIPMGSGNVIADIRAWLTYDKNTTPRLLREKCLIAIFPDECFGDRIWPAEV